MSDLRLDTERLQRRRFCPEDLAHVIEWCEDAVANSESEARRFLDFCFRQYEQGGEGPWAGVLKATQKIVGDCEFRLAARRTIPPQKKYCGKSG